MAQGLPIYADTAALGRLAKNLRAASPAAWKAYKVSVRAAAQVILDDAKANASYSSRIQSGKVKVTSGGNVKLVFDAPNAAPIENKGKGFVRHPVFIPKDKLPGPPGRWTAKHSHPAFAAPAIDAGQEAMLTAIETAITNAVARALGL